MAAHHSDDPIRTAAAPTRGGASSPGVSVIVPTIGRIQALREALRSLLSQTHRDWHCWVVCDHPPSAPSVRALLEELADPRFRLIENAPPHGVSRARNLGIASSQDEIIAFLDDDDLWLPQKLELHVAVHSSSPRPCVVYSGAILAFEDDALPPFRVPAAELPPDLVDAVRSGRFGTLTLSTVSVSRACFAEVEPFDSGLPCGEDIELLKRLAERFPFRRLDTHPVVYHEHGGWRLSTDGSRLLEALEVLEARWQGPVMGQRGWARERLCRIAMLAAVRTGRPRDRLSALIAYGRIARPVRFGWWRWTLEGIRHAPRGLPRLLLFALAGARLHQLARSLGRFDRVAAASLAEARRTAQG